MNLITKRKRMMDSVGHYARPELLSLNLEDRATSPVHTMSRDPSQSLPLSTALSDAGPVTDADAEAVRHPLCRVA